MPQPRTSTPPPVRRAFVLWVTAVAAGVFETALAVVRGSADAPGVAVRVLVFAVALWVAGRMRAGRNWARLALALGLGVLGTASMVAEPLRAVLTGAAPAAALSGTDGLLFGASRTLHVAAVLTAVWLMFRPAARAYFRA
ncbi:hypothetical protein [Streptomyces sp. HNM0574]|uniref:hypothetical protein n=1 Tax=Streptomyces sp. HNM0574 TaxID=2714954 RepID=UPI00146AF3E1|nr:hypothetical protein [Streptomyces sp. HNM0574]NLU66078.1 hypothetical protein [Streptomyces sp. HNM0574]